MEMTKLRVSEMAALKSWPRFAPCEEDLVLCDKTKWARYDGMRPIVWDMTNIPAYRFNDAGLQRGTWSDYCGMNCLKAGVHLQLCGHGGNEDAWGGGCGDSDYNKGAGYLEDQQRFQEEDLVRAMQQNIKRGIEIKFTNT